VCQLRCYLACRSQGGTSPGSCVARVRGLTLGAEVARLDAGRLGLCGLCERLGVAVIADHGSSWLASCSGPMWRGRKDEVAVAPLSRPERASSISRLTIPTSGVASLSLFACVSRPTTLVDSNEETVATAIAGTRLTVPAAGPRCPIARCCTRAQASGRRETAPRVSSAQVRTLGTKLVERCAGCQGTERAS